KDDQLQAPRLAVQPATLLGRALSDPLEDRPGWAALSRGPAGICPAAGAAATRGLQTQSRRPAAAGARAGLGELARWLPTRNQLDAAMGRQLLVLPPLPGCAQ